MAISSVAGCRPATLAASTGGVSVTRDALRPYTVWHTGKDAAGAPVTDLVAVGLGAAPTAADYSEDANKIPLEPGGVCVLPALHGSALGEQLTSPNSIVLKSAANAPMIVLIPGPREYRC